MWVPSLLSGENRAILSLPSTLVVKKVLPSLPISEYEGTPPTVAAMSKTDSFMVVFKEGWRVCKEPRIIVAKGFHG